MEVILKQDIEYLGYKDDIVNVKDGYGRNFLIPKGYATLATVGIKKGHLEMLKQRLFKEEKEIEDANKKSDAIKTLEIKILAKVAEGGSKLFGSVTSSNFAEALDKEGFEIDKKYISLPGRTVKTLGKSTATIRLHREVALDLEFEILPSEKPKAKAKAKQKAAVEEEDIKANKIIDNVTDKTKEKKQSIDEVAQEVKLGVKEDEQVDKLAVEETSNIKEEKKQSVDQVAKEVKLGVKEDEKVDKLAVEETSNIKEEKKQPVAKKAKKPKEAKK